VRFVAVILVVPHAREVKLLQLPEKSCILVPELERLVPSELNVIVLVVAVAVKEYHTSSSGVPEQVAAVPLDVALHTVPDEFIVPTVSTVAVEQLSFVGGATCVTQILNEAAPVGAPEAIENTRT